jgi:hypothetical protein
MVSVSMMMILLMTPVVAEKTDFMRTRATMMREAMIARAVSDRSRGTYVMTHHR